ncbi:Gfo/Idh/MocA family protein [Vibrio mangrovi]|uniref:Gfo/Idh/MocA family oxidoreductase n=1 Tax=Vibrio mangrovi TaxID=474394 RepID=A0A1Y6IN05_9VIBR|nr:Gfo/Idh/MocA family oxidoreductase [Vibrio mangrovi]MDW6004159.1 Gfo/Idh/MocA family oxidoreductase [Vibrio mangrovi]SMR99044.1 Glucose-6-phosphate 3-dehydrogenase [Vibrio mangrovi]
MSRANINAVIIGTGMIAHVHFRSLKAAGVNVVGLVDANREQAEAVAKSWQVRVFDNAQEAFDSEEVNVIHVCTPNRFHYELAKGALIAGKHVICEKPLATTLEDALELKALAEQHNVVHAVPFVYRYHPMVREAKALIESGETGALHLIHGSYLQDWLLDQTDNNWRVDPKQGGASRAFADIGSHWCDLVEWITGERFVELVANFHTAQSERNSDTAETFSSHHTTDENAEKVKVTTEDIATLLMRTNKNTPATLTVSQVSAGRKNRLWFEIDASEQSIEFDQETPEQLWVSTRKSRSLLVRDPSQGSDEQKRLSLTPAGHAQGYSHCFDAFIKDVYDTILGESPLGVPTFTDGLRAARLIDASLRSVKEKRWVSVE